MANINYVHLFKPAVLLVEDDKLTQKIQAYTFTELGCDVFTADNVRTALEMLENPYDLIILDVGLPDQSGIHLAQTIRRGNTKQQYDIPIFVVSAYTAETDRAKYMSAGANEVLAKPMDHEKVKNILIRLVEKSLHQSS